MTDCTKDSPCAACAAGLERQASRRPEYGAGSRYEPVPRPRRFHSWDSVLCKRSLLPRNTCGGCEAGHHHGEAWA